MLKFMKRVRSRLLSSAATGFIAALAMGGTVVAITDTQFLYSSPKTGYLSIHPNLALSPLPDQSCSSTGVNLPQGSRITQLAVWYSSPAAGNPFVILERSNLADGSFNSLIVSGDINDDSNTRKLAVIPLIGGSSPVSNIGLAYGFGFCPGTDGTFHGARIAYTYTNAGD